jgi:hypothetical protein
MKPGSSLSISLTEPEGVALPTGSIPALPLYGLRKGKEGVSLGPWGQVGLLMWLVLPLIVAGWVWSNPWPWQN